ncbi:MAG TPA: M20 family metallopeptidase [Trebonia sp.]|nr:M20 family metallopeptidase [Trebonia sp.]
MTGTAGATSVVTRLGEFIAAPSPTPPGDVAQVAGMVADWAAAMGATVTRQEVEPGLDNVLALLRFGPGPRLVFNSHMDVTNPDQQVWSTPPYQPVIRDGRLYGRGACDAKGSLVAMLTAMEALARQPGGLAGELLLTAVMGEEAGGIGSAYLVGQGISGDGAVVGEPTGLRIASAHKGTYIRQVTFRGIAAHSAFPWLGRNAVLPAAAFCLLCEEQNAILAQSPHPLVGPATLTVTLISGGTLQNTVPGQATVTVDRRLIPGHTHADCDDELTRILERLTASRPDAEVEDISVIVATSPSQTPDGAPIVDAALAAAADIGRPQAGPVGFGAGCDMSKLVNTAGIPTVICGPGHLDQAHRPDEFVDVGQVEEAALLYERIARRFLAGPSPASPGPTEEVDR